MSLSQAQIATVDAHLKSVFTSGCVLCHGGSFAIGEIIHTAFVAGTTIMSGSNGVEMLQVICNTCFRVELFDRRRLGI